MKPDIQTLIALFGLLVFSIFMAYAGLINPRIWVRTHGSKDQRRRIQDFQLANDVEFVAKCRISGAAGAVVALSCIYGLYLNIQTL